LEELLTILMDSRDGDVSADLLRRSLLQNRELITIFYRAWPLLEAATPAPSAGPEVRQTPRQ
jgi:hypothetical protein